MGAVMRKNFKKLISSQDVIHQFGITYPTLNHYTNLGFLRVVAKRGNKRFYQEIEVKMKLDEVTKLKNEGYPLGLIKKKFEKEKYNS